MLLREALRLGQTVPKSRRRLALLSSFEPLHLKTYLQAYCVQRLAEEPPLVVGFGFDQLAAGMEATRGELSAATAVLALSWEDLHPALHWRSRGRLDVLPQDVLSRGQEFAKAIEHWISARSGLTVVALPPRSWLPFHDPCPPGAVGAVQAAAHAALWDTVRVAIGAGARVLEAAEAPLNFRDLLQAGHPLTLEACEALAARIVEAAFPVLERKKAIIVDLDGTLWGGVIGEDGPQGLSCRAEGAGFAHHVFQKFLLKLKGEGALLAFCSKNNPQDVLPFFDSLDMPLRLADFAARRCNWDSKPDNLRAIAQELNIGLDSLVFVDDNDAELAEARAALPQVAALRAPRDESEWPAFFAELQRLFGAWRLSDEDRLRAESVAARRVAAAAPVAGLRDLGLKLAINPAAFFDPRSLELVNKTNQFNLTGERLSQDQWLALTAAPGSFCLSARLSDRYGDFGTICVLAGSVDGERAVLRQFVLSCRAFGRRVETLVLGEALRRTAAKRLDGPFKDTGKNEPARRFLASLGGDVSAGQWSLEAAVVEKAALRAVEETGAKIVQTVPNGPVGAV